MPASRFECPRCQTMFVKDTGGEAAFVECPSCGALALPAGDATNDAMARALSGPHPNTHSGMSTEAEQPHLARTSSDPSMPGFSDPNSMPGTGAGVFSGLLAAGDPSGPQVPAPPPPPPPRATPDALDFDFTNEVDLDLGKQSKPKAAPAPAKKPAAAPPRKSNVPASVATLPNDALSALNNIEESTGAKRPGPWGGFSDEAFGDLEKAFDEMSVRQPAPGRAKGGLSADEAAFLRGEDPTNPPGGVGADGPTGRREAPPRPPPKRSSKPARARPAHLALSDEARRLAFVPLKTEPPRRSTEQPSEAAARRHELKLERHLEAVSERAVSAETTDMVREKKAPPRQVPSAFAGLSFLRVVGIVVLATLLGAGGGVLLTPKPQRPNTQRARAELTLAEGNKFYTEGRYDDALGKYREANRIDKTYALAHRARGAALAKMQRHDDAADAYRLYLDLEANALDAADVKEAIARREKAQ